MRNVMAILCSVAGSLWFGGTMALFLFVSTLFSQDRPTALAAAPRMFLVFEKYQLVLAAVALLAAFTWRILTPSRWITSVLVTLALAGAAAAMSAALVTPKMETIRAAGESSGPAFRRLHGISMMIYTFEAALLLIATLLLPAAIRTTTAPHAAQRKS
jgi:hypothetical protein